MSVPGKKYFVIGSLEKGVRIIELLAEHEAMSVSEVAAALDINRSSSHRFLATLRELGWVSQGEDDNRYRLTFRILEQAMKMADRFEIRRVARPCMQQLAALSGETVNLGYWDGHAIVHLDKIDSPNILRIDARIGSHVPAYCTGLGKSILAHLPESERESYLSELCLAGAALSADDLRADLANIRERGFAVDDEEMAPGLRCVAAAVFDHTDFPRYALSISGPAMRLTLEQVGDLGPQLRKITDTLSTQLGKPSRQAIPARRTPLTTHRKSNKRR